MNSPMKFDEPGIARFANVTIRNRVASTGARKATPPMSSSALPPTGARSERATTKNAAAVTTPWLSICRSAPWPPCGRSEKIPSRMKPIWATLE